MEHKPYWVQLEHNPEGQDTAFCQWDLSLVQGIKCCYIGDVLDVVVIIYPPLMPTMTQQICEGIAFKGNIAQEFMRAWNTYREDRGLIMQYQSDRAEPSNVIVSKQIPEGLHLKR